MNHNTSISSPIRVDLLGKPILSLRGSLGLTFAPGKKGPSSNGQTYWDRDLTCDLTHLKQAYHTDVLVSLMEAFEFEMLRIPTFFDDAAALGIDVLHFPIRDVSAPHTSQNDAFDDLIERIQRKLEEGANVVIHCRGGVGRTGIVACSVLVRNGYAPADAIRAVRSVRYVVETPRQEQYVHDYAQRLKEKHVEPA